MRTTLIAFIASAAVMLPLDALWLTTIAKDFYSRNLNHLFAETPSLIPAAVFYLLYAGAVALLVVVPAVTGGFSLGKTYLYGVALGLAAYGAYDLTNQATLRDWPVMVTIVDLTWGALLTGLVGTIAGLITKYFA